MNETPTGSRAGSTSAANNATASGVLDTHAPAISHTNANANDNENANIDGSRGHGGENNGDVGRGNATTNATSTTNANANTYTPPFFQRSVSPNNDNHNNNSNIQNPGPGPAKVIRQLRHSEVVLVDEVSVHYNKYWLRLRWPGPRGGIAGYIVLGGTNSVPNDRVQEWKERLRGAVGGLELEGFSAAVSGTTSGDGGGGPVETNVGGEKDSDDADIGSSNEYEDKNNQDSDNESTDEEPAILRGPAGSESKNPMHFAPRCETTGLYFPSTTTMELLAPYDDGISGLSVVSTDDNDNEDGPGGEPVFCRICREGLHDVDDEFEAAGGPPGAGEPNGNNAAPNSAGMNNNNNAVQSDTDTSNHNINRPTGTVMTGGLRRTGNSQFGGDDERNNNNVNAHGQRQQPEAASNFCTVIQPGKPSPSPPPQHADQIHHPYATNPFLSPCECSGSMAFVHYMCIEQWRCRSHHPAARNGLNCETCNASYTLPPPPSRPDVNEEEDWLEAMPPHVLQALRRPHPCWRIGAAIVRRRWLRPIAPVIMSPVVALYCRARRTLKKRGVSRRRWACSLCRRRARWKCVRCLRSYYCSRQCQNVSWHIVHKHVCYKPVRFWWSVVIYGLAFILLVPGVLSDPFIYDLEFSFLWLSFVLTGVIGGGFASLMKRRFGYDIRGRTLELIVVIMTFWLASVFWGLTWAYFGEPSQCKGVFNFNSGTGSPFDSSTSGSGSTRINFNEDGSYKLGMMTGMVRNYFLGPATTALKSVDKLLLRTGPLVTSWICHKDEVNTNSELTSCTRLAKTAQPDFMIGENGGNCISDMNTVIISICLAQTMHLTSILWKRNDRLARRHPRPHQD